MTINIVFQRKRAKQVKTRSSQLPNRCFSRSWARFLPAHHCDCFCCNQPWVCFDLHNTKHHWGLRYFLHDKQHMTEFFVLVTCDIYLTKTQKTYVCYLRKFRLGCLMYGYFITLTVIFLWGSWGRPRLLWGFPPPRLWPRSPISALPLAIRSCPSDVVSADKSICYIRCESTVPENFISLHLFWY